MFFAKAIHSLWSDVSDAAAALGEHAYINLLWRVQAAFTPNHHHPLGIVIQHLILCKQTLKYVNFNAYPPSHPSIKNLAKNYIQTFTCLTVNCESEFSRETLSPLFVKLYGRQCVTTWSKVPFFNA